MYNLRLKERHLHDALANPGIGKLGFQWGGLHHRLEDQHELLSQDPGALQCLYNCKKHQAGWVTKQRKATGLPKKGKKSITSSRIQTLESLNFEWTPKATQQ
jgi:hypothetical protein